MKTNKLLISVGSVIAAITLSAGTAFAGCATDGLPGSMDRPGGFPERALGMVVPYGPAGGSGQIAQAMAQGGGIDEGAGRQSPGDDRFLEGGDHHLVDGAWILIERGSGRGAGFDADGLFPPPPQFGDKSSQRRRGEGNDIHPAR